MGSSRNLNKPTTVSQSFPSSSKMIYQNQHNSRSTRKLASWRYAGVLTLLTIAFMLTLVALHQCLPEDKPAQPRRRLAPVDEDIEDSIRLYLDAPFKNSNV